MTTPLSIATDLDRSPWEDLDLSRVEEGVFERVGLLRHGTTEGRAAVAIVVRLADGTPIVAQTTWRLFTSAHRVLAASPTIAEETSD